MIDKFTALPFEILREIFSYLNNDDIRSVAATHSSLASTIITDESANIFWEARFKEQFPHIQLTNNGSEINWYNKFFKTYDDQYGHFDAPQKELFSKAKAGKLTSLSHLTDIPLIYLLICDRSGRDLFSWINPTFKPEQPVLDEFFTQKILPLFKQEAFPHIDFHKKHPNSRDERRILHWAVACNQVAWLSAVFALQINRYGIGIYKKHGMVLHLFC